MISMLGVSALVAGLLATASIVAPGISGAGVAGAAPSCTVGARSTVSPVLSTAGDSCTDNGNGTFTATFTVDPNVCTQGPGGSCLSYDTTITPLNATPNYPSGPYTGGVECSFLDLGHFVPNYSLNGSDLLGAQF
ncbi:MAG: hypothetical protein KGQ66_07235, partial [Acidobacteriota bacterium]|nr:hypothetical protein [Acidobacteriota bacterium]